MNANESFLRDSESVVLCDNMSVLHGNESVVLFDNVSVVLFDNVSVVLFDNVSVVLSDNESVVLSENQSVVFSGNSDSVVNGMVDCANDYSVAESDFVCPGYLKTFTNKYNLKRHANKLHPNNIALINSLKNDRLLSFNCEYCHLKFSIQKNLRHHLNKIHTTTINQTDNNYMCPLCYGKFEKREIIFHFKNVRDIDMNHIELEFNSFNDCLAWKAEIESRTKSKFVSYDSNTHGVKCYYFRCHRSGNFVSDSKGLRHLKILGSNKINAYFPAALKVTQHTDGKCVVSYQKIHIGHQNDIGHLFLTADERKIIASKIAAKISLDNTLLDNC
ncbi:c2H2-type domain-containing protein [Trichonephila clavipes]|nr:c2H2-type domain-containing protein [Trichonephila clavipes]